LKILFFKVGFMKHKAAMTMGTLSVLALLVPTPLLAQDLTDEQLLNLFLAQRDAFRAAEQSDTGQTRGLTLVTLENVDVVTETATLVTPSTGDSSGATAGNDTAVATGDAPASPDAPEGDSLTVATDAPEAPEAPTTDGTVVAMVEPDPETVPTPVVIGDLAPELQVNVRIEFDFDSAALNDAQKPKLTQLCNVMKASDIKLFRITGHTDASGSDDYNQNLSLLRAEEVQRFFISDCGIDATRLQAVGLGERLIPKGADPRSPENRRVEFQALA